VQIDGIPIHAAAGDARQVVAFPFFRPVAPYLFAGRVRPGARAGRYTV
jgi:hypothetical protein